MSCGAPVWRVRITMSAQSPRPVDSARIAPPFSKSAAFTSRSTCAGFPYTSTVSGTKSIRESGPTTTAPTSLRSSFGSASSIRAPASRHEAYMPSASAPDV